MVFTDTQGSARAGVLDRVYPADAFVQTSPPLIPKNRETYDDPRKNYGFHIAVRMGDSNQENRFHPSHPILQRLKDEGFELSRIPISSQQEIHVDDYHFHRVPHPAVDMHRVDPKQVQKAFLFNEIIIGMNKNVREDRYQYKIFDPLDLVLKHSKTSTSADNQIRLEYKDSQGQEQSLEKSFSHQDMYGYGDESLFIGWLKNSVQNIIDQALI